MSRQYSLLLLGLWVVLPPAGAATDSGGLAAAARAIVGARQGVYVEAADGTALVSQAAADAVHPASVSKVPTTLALLRKFGSDHRFATRFAVNGPIRDGVLEGDLFVESDGDPFFVDENALLVAEQLRGLGIARVAGGLRTHGTLTFDWVDDQDGTHLQQVLSGHAPAAAWGTVAAIGGELTGPVPPPVIHFGEVAGATTAAPSERTLLIHKSQPLVSMAKLLNDYSNNIFKPFADAAGGAASVQALARSVVPAEMRDEITLGDGAGTDPANRLSPRAAVKLLRALEQELMHEHHSLVEILPVAGIDDGTLQKRLDGPGEAGRIVGKTGTFGDYGASALVGAISTTDRGTVYFAILNHGVPVPEARRRQDRFVRVLLARLHTRPWPYQPDPRPAVARATVQLASGP